MFLRQSAPRLCGFILHGQARAGQVQQADRQAVRDDVMQFAGDPLALLGPAR